MSRLSVLLVLLLACLLIRPALAGDEVDPELLTVAERSGFRATSTHAEVIELMDRLAERSAMARRLSMGQSHEGREIPLLVFADPPVATPRQAREAVERGKLLVLLFGNIHAGEVAGKEALLMLARELATTPEHPLLENLVIAIAPIYNTDGNERMSPDNRPGQVGPEEGMGTRHNAQGLDLNRDFVKLDAPETHALLRFFRQWDPHLVIDTHTTNGSLHRFLITYSGPRHPAGDQELIDYAYEKMLPAITESLRDRTGIETFFYGNFAEQHTQWHSFPPVPRFSTNYLGMRNRLGILSEAYSYAGYEDRIRGTLEFVRENLTYAMEHRHEIADLLRAADERSRTSADPVALRSEVFALPGDWKVLGYVEERRDGRTVPGEEREYEVEVFDAFRATLEVAKPWAYLIAPGQKLIVENLQRHGIQVEEVREDIEIDATVYRVDSVERQERPFQGRRLVTLEATPEVTAHWVEAGSHLVRTDQPLGRLAAFLLEPQSEDGLATWGFLDNHLEIGEAFPIVRLEEQTPLLTTAARALDEDRIFGRPLDFTTLYEARQRPNFNGSPASGLRWLDDEHYLQRRGREMHRVHAATGRSEPLFDADAMADALAELSGIDARSAVQIAFQGRFRFSDDFTAALFSHRNDLYHYHFERDLAVRLTDSPDTEEELYEFSPDGAFVSFVRHFDLWVVDVESQQERPLTTDGSDNLRNGKADWVYFEELYGRSWKVYWWSPDSSRIAFIRTDSSMVGTFTLADDLPEPQVLHVARYPKAGTPNPQVQLGIASPSGGDLAWADLTSYPADDLLISGVGWLPDSSALYFFGQNRQQTWMDLCRVDRDGGEPELLLHDSTDAWIQPRGRPWFLDDGSLLILSDRSGWRHLYHVENCELSQPVTDCKWDVRSVLHVDEHDGWAYVLGTRDSHIATNLYRARLDGSRIERLTRADGSHSASLNPAGTMYIDTWSSRDMPSRVALFSADGQLVRTLDSNPVYIAEEFVWGDDEQFQIETSDGFLLEASWVKPPDFDPSKRYPVWITTYGGPYAPSIRDQWRGGRTWDQMLASEGIVVFRVDPRNASGKGPQSAWTSYRQLGVQEVQDLEEAVRWLTRHEWVDPSRIGLSGHSYGGYVTAYAMTRTRLFRAGIAGAPVTDWRLYDTIYTERYMGTPQENPEGYDRSSVITGAADLHGELLLIHGTLDDNVHAQNTMQLVVALQEAGKNFQLMVYPRARHGIRGRHYDRLTYDFIRRTMGVEDDGVADRAVGDREVEEADNGVDAAAPVGD